MSSFQTNRLFEAFALLLIMAVLAGLYLAIETGVWHSALRLFTKQAPTNKPKPVSDAVLNLVMYL